MKRILLVLFLSLLSLYIAAGGWVASGANAPSNDESVTITGSVFVDGHEFADLKSAQRYLQEKEIDTWFPWTRNPLPALFIACLGFGLLGGAIGRLKNLISGDSITALQIFLQWVFTGFLGIVLYFIFSVFFDRPSGNLYFIVAALVGGIFFDETFSWIKTYVFSWIFPKEAS